MRGKRRFLAYLVEPFKQIRFGLHVVTVCFAFAALVGIVFVHAFREQYQQVVEIFKVIDQNALVENTVFYKNSIIMGSVLAAFVVSIVAVVVRRTHRMYGPMVSIERFVDELKKGNYAVRINIRERDDFQSLVTQLNQLAEALHSRHGVQVSPKEGLDGLADRLQDFESGVVTIASPKSKKDGKAS